MVITISLIIGYILDMIFGDPYFLPHPVVFIGGLISKTEKLIRKIFPKTKQGQIIGGAVLAIIVIGISFFASLAVLGLIYKLNFWAGFILETFWIYQLLATKCLKVESMKVYDELKNGDLENGRVKISYLVGRDTKNLSEAEVIKATVETVAENTCDGSVAPLLFMAIGGVPLGFLYKAINTLDSMVGYKNDKYLYFGRVSAYLDDLANFIPSRLSGIFMAVSTIFLRLDTKSAFRIFLRDRNNHLSPNSAQTESVAAGALNIQLGGTHDYFGKKVVKPTIGDNIKSVECEDIKRANNLLYATSFIALVIFCIVRMFIISII